MSDSPFKTTWAGMDAKIHAKKPTWSVGNFSTPGISNIPSSSSNNASNCDTTEKHENHESTSMNHTTQVHMWVLSGLLSWFLTRMNNTNKFGR